jgi:hypothetical protein
VLGRHAERRIHSGPRLLSFKGGDARR